MSDFWERKSPLQKTKFVLGLILCVIIIVFAIANWRTTMISFIFADINIPLTIIILGSMVFGYIIAAFMEGFYKKKQERKRNNEIQSENQDN